MKKAIRSPSAKLLRRFLYCSRSGSPRLALLRPARLEGFRRSRDVPRDVDATGGFEDFAASRCFSATAAWYIASPSNPRSYAACASSIVTARTAGFFCSALKASASCCLIVARRATFIFAICSGLTRPSSTGVDFPSALVRAEPTSVLSISFARTSSRSFRSNLRALPDVWFRAGGQWRPPATATSSGGRIASEPHDRRKARNEHPRFRGASCDASSVLNLRTRIGRRRHAPETPADRLAPSIDAERFNEVRKTFGFHESAEILFG